MPIRDHFHAPIHPRFAWESFHAVWGCAILEWLNRHLPPRYLSQMHTHFRQNVEAEILETAASPVAMRTMPAVFPDDIEVQVIDTRDGAVLVAVIELVSPGNLDRPGTRIAFAAKCAAYLQRGIGVIVIDIVTKHRFNLHNALIDLLGHAPAFRMADDPPLYAVAYAPARRDDTNLIDLWPVPPAVGGAMPTLTLALRGGPRVALDLDGTYNDARLRSRIP